MNIDRSRPFNDAGVLSRLVLSALLFVEKLVADPAVTPSGRKAALQLARVTQVALATSTSEKRARRNGAETARTQACMTSQAPGFAICLSAVCAHTLNTGLRRLARAAFEEKFARLEFIRLQGVFCQPPSSWRHIR